MNSQTVNSLYNFLPELSLALLIVTTNVFAVLLKGSGKLKFYFTASGFLVVFALTLLGVYTQPQTAFDGLLVLDHFAYTAKVLIVLSTLIFFIIFYTPQNNSSEFTLLQSLTLGAMLAIGSSDLVMLFVSLEVMSISIYILISKERTISLKYYVYGITSSALMIYGISLIYGICGTTGYYGISEFLSVNTFNPLTLTISVLLIISGIGFRMMLFPFNFFFPSLAEKLPLRQLAFISVTGTVTMAIALVRFLLTVFHEGNTFITGADVYSIIPGVNWGLMVSILSAASIITGSLVILWQRNLKKIYAFLLIGQAGNLLIGLASASPDGTDAVIFNSIALILILTGLLLCLRIFEDKFQAVTIDDLKQKGKSSPLVFFSFLFFLGCAAGLPLTIGFSGRLMLVFAAISGNLFWLAAVSILTSFVMFYFIFKLTYEIFSGKPLVNQLQAETHHKFILLVLMVTAILLGFYPGAVIDWVRFASLIFGIGSGS